MTRFGRRRLLGETAAIAGAALVCPNIALAAERKTLNIWWNQGFYPAEDQALATIVRGWEKESGIKVNLSMVATSALTEKVTSALATGQVPDLIYSDEGPTKTVPLAAWKDQLLDVSDVVASQEHEYSKTALESGRFYDSVARKRSYYSVPIRSQTLNIPAWKTLIEKAGYQMSDIPKTWDRFFDFFKLVQDKLRKKGMRHIYGLGYTLSTSGTDPIYLFGQFLVAYGGGGVVSPDGAPHFDDEAVQKAITTTLARLTTPYREGYVPPSSINWGDADNNNAFHAGQVVMTPNATISISSAVQDNRQLYYRDIVTLPLPLANDGKPVPALQEVLLAYIPKGSKNVDGAKNFLRFLIEPRHLDAYLKEARGRYLPVMPSIVRNDPYWLDPKDPHRLVAVRQGVLGATQVWPFVYSPGYAQVDAEELWGVAEADVINGATPEDAWAKISKRVTTIFSKYQIV